MPVIGSGASALKNIKQQTRDSFESFNTDKWELSQGSGDLVYVDGNAVSASYLVISKSPFGHGTETSISSKDRFKMPFDVGVGASLSQRTLGQEFSIELVDDALITAPTDLAIASISQTATVLTVNTTLPHNLPVGKRIQIVGVSDSLYNYSNLVVATTPSTTQFTCTAGAGGTIPSLTIATVSNSGFVKFRPALGLSANGSSIKFENTSTTNASIYTRSDAGDTLPSGTPAGAHSVTTGSTSATQAVNSAYNYAFLPATEFRVSQMLDRIQFSDITVDGIAAPINRLTRSQVVPRADKSYKLRFRAVTSESVTKPVARILSVAKTGTTTATITFAEPHGLTIADQINAYGVRDQTNFANLDTATAIASVVSPTVITVVWGSAVTATSFGGYVAKVNGSVTMSSIGAIAQVASTATLTNGIVTLVCNTTVTGLLIGETCNLYGVGNAVDGATLGIDGAYRVINVATTTLELERIDGGVMPADFTVTDCGGGVIKRTDFRIHFSRVIDFERLRIETLARPVSDQATAMPVLVQNGISSVTVSGSTAQDNATPNPVAIGGRATSVNQTAMSAAGDLVHTAHTMIGALVNKPYCIPEVEWVYTGALTLTSDVVAKAAAGTGIKNHVTLIQATNTGASANSLIIKDGTTVRLQVTVPAGQSVVIPLNTGIPITANTALNVALSADGTVQVNLLGYTAP